MQAEEKGEQELVLTTKDRIEMALVSLVMLLLLVGIITGTAHIFHFGLSGWLAICLVICFAVVTINVVCHLSAQRHSFSQRDSKAA